MKWLFLFILYTNIFFPLSGSSTLLDPSEVLYLAKINDYKTLYQSFDNNHNISRQEAQQFLLETFAILQLEYPSDVSIHELKIKIIEMIKIYALDEDLFNKLKPILRCTLDTLMPDEKIFSMILIKSPLKQPTSEVEIPSCLVFGGTEILCGALLWLTPFKRLGLVLITDSCRRIGNVVEEKDKELREYPERQYHPPKYR